MEYAPPEFDFPGLQFNPDIFENPLPTTSPSGIVPDPLPIAELDTNLIQALVPASGVSLFQNALNYVNLGWASLNELNLSALTFIFRSPFIFFQNFADTCKFIVDTTVDTIGLIFVPNTLVTSFEACSILATNAAVPTGNGQGTLQITGATLKTPLNFVSNALSSALNLFTGQTGNISLGGFAVTNILYLQAKSVQIASSLITGLIELQAKTININNGTGNATYIGSLSLNAGTIATNGVTDIFLAPTNIAGKIKISGGQDIEPSNVANNFLIGNDITSANLFLGNSSFPPSCTGTATTANHITNFAKVSSMISSASILGTPNTFTGTNTFANTVSLNTTGANTTSIGNAATTTNVLGYLTLNNTGSANTDINASSNTGAVYIGNASTSSLNVTSAIGLNVTRGIRMQGTNISGVSWKVMYGVQTTTDATGSPGLSVTRTVNFGATFGDVPLVFLQVLKNTYVGAGQMCAGVESRSTTNFSYNVRNNSNTGAAANTYYVQWFAVGQY